MAPHVNVIERLAYGRPVDLDSQLTRQPVMPRDGTVLIGRILIAAIFLLSGIAKLVDPQGAIGYMTAAGIPAPEILVYVAGVAEMVGGLAVLFGVVTRLGALGLILFLVPTTLLFHDFWNLSGAEQKTQMVDFMKNLSIMGGLSLLFAYGPGRYSIDATLRRPMQA